MSENKEDRDARLKRLYYSRAISEMMKKYPRAQLVRDIVSLDDEKKKDEDGMSLDEVVEFVNENGDGKIDLEDLELAFHKIEEFMRNLETFMAAFSDGTGILGDDEKSEDKEEKEEDKGKDRAPSPPSNVPIASIPSSMASSSSSSSPEEKEEGEKDAPEAPVEEVIDVDEMRRLTIGGGSSQQQPSYYVRPDSGKMACPDSEKLACPRCEQWDKKRAKAFEECEKCKEIDERFERMFPASPERDYDVIEAEIPTEEDDGEKDEDGDADIENQKQAVKEEKKEMEDEEKDKEKKKKEEEKKEKKKKGSFFRRAGSATVSSVVPRDTSEDKHVQLHVRPWVPFAPKFVQ